MKIWVIGGSGLLGKTLLSKAHLSTSHSEADITNLNSLLKITKEYPNISHIINAAAESAVDVAEKEKEKTFQVNAIGPENLAKVAFQINARLIHISTDYVFSGEGKTPWKETDPTLPCNHYGLTKLEGEKRAQAILPSTCILRTSWLFGSGGKNFVAKLLKLMQENETVQLTSDQWGRPTYVPDLKDVIFQLLDHSGIYQFANQGATTKYEFGKAIQQIALEIGLPLKVKNILPVPSSTFPSLAPRPIYSVFDTTKIEKELHLTIKPWQKALRDYLCSANVPSHLSL